MSLRFAANLWFLFQEAGGTEARIAAAAQQGFKTVEIPFFEIWECDAISSCLHKLGMHCHLINSCPGNLKTGDLGMACDPSRVDEFTSSLESTISCARKLGCQGVHILAGKIPPNVDLNVVESTYVSNLEKAGHRLQQEGLVGLIEPLNQYSSPNYFMNDVNKAVQYIRDLALPNLKLQFDFFHVQHLHGNLTNVFAETLPYIGHIQVAQVPYRGEPGSGGEIDFNYVFGMIERSGYQGLVGLEYKPSQGQSSDSLQWLRVNGWLK